MFLKPAAYRAQREYRFVVWAEEEPEEDRVDLRISPALLDAMQRPREEPAASGFVSAGMEESSIVVAVAEVSRPSERVEVLPVPDGTDNPTVPPRRYQVKRLPGDLRERTTAHAALDALRDVVAKSDAARRKDAAAAAWHAEPIVRFLCSPFGDGISGVAGERRQLDRDHGHTPRRRHGGGERRRGAGGQLRVQDRRRRDASCVHGAGRPVVRANSEESARRYRSEPSGRYGPRLRPKI